MVCKLAEKEDINGVLELQKKYHISTICEEDKQDGFITTLFTREQLTRLIEEEAGLFIATDNDRVVAFVMAASWQYWSAWPMFAYMIEGLPNLEYLGQKLSVENSYQYGPVCIDKQYRGSGLLAEIFDFARTEMSRRYPILITFINKINIRSFEAHTRKIGLDIIQEFEYNNNQYYELGYDTSKPVR
jgi:hypothetical protein